MKLIPAIDLKNNKVVTAMQGKKRNYSEISKKLSPSSDPLTFIQYLLSIHHFNTIYLADLDSIVNFKSECSLIDKILAKFPNINFIIDNGVRKYSQLNRYKNTNYIQVVATETYEDYIDLVNERYSNLILSLDFKNKKLIKKNNNYKYLTPKKVISMNLDNIGMKNGINKENANYAKELFPNAEIIISGGIGCTSDIIEAKKNGFNEVVLLTAILEKKILYSNL